MKYLIKNQLRLLAFFFNFFFGGEGEWGKGEGGVGEGGGGSGGREWNGSGILLAK